MQKHSTTRGAMWISLRLAPIINCTRRIPELSQGWCPLSHQVLLCHCLLEALPFLRSATSAPCPTECCCATPSLSLSRVFAVLPLPPESNFSFTSPPLPLLYNLLADDSIMPALPLPCSVSHHHLSPYGIETMRVFVSGQ